MSCEELQAPLAMAIADLENARLRLLEVYEFASAPRNISDQERSDEAMQIELVRVALPVLDIRLRDALKVLIGAEPSWYISFVNRDGQEEQPR